MQRAIARATALIGTVTMLTALIASIVFWYEYQNCCGDYLKLAGDAPTMEKANRFLGKALEYIEKEGLTSENSAFIFHTPSNDIGIWYEQIKGTRNTTDVLLARIKEDPTTVPQLDRDNALIRIREVLLDNSKGGVAVTEPSYITWFPNQWDMLLWWFAGVALTIIGWFWVYLTNDY